jgi:hypothetical protein
MAQHKWHKEIKAWADGAEIEYKFHTAKEWLDIDEPQWDVDGYDYRIKPQPKEPQYLYVYRLDGHSIRISQNNDNETSYKGQFLGKIKLEVDD